MLVRIRTEIERKQADRVGHLLAHGLGHGRGGKIPDRALHCTGFESPLHLSHQVVGLSVGVNIHGDLAGLVVSDLIVAVAETSHCQWNLTLPSRDACVSVHRFAGLFTRGYQHCIFRTVKRQIKVRARRETVGALGIPAGALTKIITVAGLANGTFARVVKFKRLWLTKLEGLSEYDGSIVAVRLEAVFVFARLVKTQSPSLGVFD